MQIIDSHTHLDFDEFNVDRNLVIKRALAGGISNIIISSTIAERWHLVKRVCDESNKVCHPAYGLHPMFMNQHKLYINDHDGNVVGNDSDVSNNSDLVKLESWLNDNEAIAIGEIGLDFFIEEADNDHRKAQLDLFVAQLEIATEHELPVIIHARKSLDIVLKHLRKFPSIRGSIHSFSGSEQQAKQLIDLGYYLSFGGPITYNRATRLHKLIKSLPLDAMLVETDSPDQPDTHHHAGRNEPSYIIQIIDKITELKKIDREQVALQTTNNAINLFNLIDD